MAFWIPMVKTQENEDFVSYFFYTFARDKKLESEKSRIAVGFCTYNKKTKECSLDKERSDPFFTERPGYFDNVHIKLLRLQRANQEFPEETGFYS